MNDAPEQIGLIGDGMGLWALAALVVDAFVDDLSRRMGYTAALSEYTRYKEAKP